MSLEDAIVAMLAAGSRTTALVGSRVSPKIVPQGESLPALTYQVISNPRSYVASGLVDGSMARVQINCIATTMAGARAVLNALRDDLADLGSGFGLGGPRTFAGMELRGVFIEDESDLPDEREAGVDSTTRFGKRMDISIDHLD